MYEKLLKEIEYAKTAVFKRQSLYHVYGRIRACLKSRQTVGTTAIDRPRNQILSQNFMSKSIYRHKFNGVPRVPLSTKLDFKHALTMARELGAITVDEYMQLNHACVYEGINNHKYFD